MQTLSIRNQIHVFMTQGNQFFAQAVSNGDYSTYAKAIQEFTSAYKYALLLNARDGTEEICCFNLGAAHIAGGDTVRGIDLMQTVLEFGSRRMKDNEKDFATYKGDTHFNMAIGYEKLGNTEKAIKSYTAALLEYNRQKNPKRTCEAYLKIATIYNARHDYSAAHRNYELASKLYWESKDVENSLMARICQANAACRDKTYDRDENVKLLNACCRDVSSIENRNLQGKILCEVGILYSMLGSLDSALFCFETSIKLFDPQTNARRCAIAYQNAGAILNDLHYFEESLTRHMQAAHLHGILLNRKAQGESFCNLAFAQSQLQQPDSAWESYKHALKAYEDTGDWQGQWQCHEALGSLAFNNTRGSKAVFHFQSAVSCLSNIQNVSVKLKDNLVRKLHDAIKMEKQGDIYRSKPLQPKVTKSTTSPVINHQQTYENDEVDSPTVPKTSQKINKHWERGRREYSDDNDRPIRHVARGISNLTDTTSSYASARSFRSEDSSSDSNDELNDAKNMSVRSIATDGSVSAQKEGNLGKHRRHRKHIRNLIKTTAMPINSVTSMQDIEQSPRKDSDGESPDAVDSGRNLNECYKKQLAKIEEASSEDDLTEVTTKSESESTSSDDDQLSSSKTSKRGKGHVQRHADDSLPATPKHHTTTMRSDESSSSMHLYATVQKDWKAETSSRAPPLVTSSSEQEVLETPAVGSASQVSAERVIAHGVSDSAAENNRKIMSNADNESKTDFPPQNRSHQKKNKQSKLCTIM